MRFGRNDFDHAVAVIAIMAFWGLARSGDLTYKKKHWVLAYNTAWLKIDVAFSRRAARTAKPGAPQPIVLARLCRVALLDTTGTATSSFHRVFRFSGTNEAPHASI
ncbi:hypothetical protein PtB15_10B98 [Puccinia triticina]|nr:hypothetical protein PtB15_10B98 [Puccinia triticina]